MSFNQGINVRLIDAEVGEALTTIKYYDDSFKQRRLYTAWDNLKDEGIFTRGVGHLLAAGVRPFHIMVYMLIGYDPAETWERIFYRLNIMLEMGLTPYPMVYNRTNKVLGRFQKWVVGRYYQIIPWSDFIGRYKDVTADFMSDMRQFDAQGPGVTKRRKRRAELLANG